MNIIMKRSFDIVLTIIGFILAAPVMALIAIFIRLESPGPVIFSQERLGFKGRPFRMHKFRKFPAKWKDAGPGVTTAGDARMTCVGRVLERLKFDELPQLWNILKGEMSFVGPRPESLRFKSLFTGEYEGLLNHVPGIFGPNQFALRNECDLYPADEDPEHFYCRVLFPQKAQRDLVYFEKANLFRDMGCIVMGLWASISGVVNWHRFFKRHSRILFADMLAVAGAWSLAHLLRFEGISTTGNSNIYLNGLWILPCSIVFTMLLGSCYANPMRSFSLSDAARLVVAATFSLSCGFILLFSLDRGISLYLLPLTWFILVPFLGLPRILVRMRWERRQDEKRKSKNRIMIYGAGLQGMALARCVGNGNLVGFIDDGEFMRGRRIVGYQVLGRESDIPNIHEVHQFNEIWVTFKMTRAQRGRMELMCTKRDISLVYIPDQEPFARLIYDQPEDKHCPVLSSVQQ
jgi:lipopolysaccharide/colanic/teichoic acid biosynthesis glycosyltransferase